MRMIVRLDEEKIAREGKYDVDKLYSILNNYVKKQGLKISKDVDGNYVWEGDGDLKKEIVQFCNVYNTLKWEATFFYNVKMWIGYEPYAFCGNDSLYPVDLIKHWSEEYKKNGKMYNKKII